MNSVRRASSHVPSRSSSIIDLAEALSPPPVVRVLFDARKLGDGGIGTYIEGMVQGLLAVNARGKMLWNSPINPSTKLSRFPHAEITLLADSDKLAEYAWAAEVDVVDSKIRPYSAAEMFRLARSIEWNRFDLFHTPHYTLPFGVPIPSVVTLHDLIHTSYPEHWYYPFVARRLIKSAVRRATRVLAVSRSTLEEAKAELSLEESAQRRFRVVPNAVDPFFLNAAPAPIGQTQSPYLLAVASMDKPHKGLGDLLDAWEMILLREGNWVGGSEVRLVLGGFGWSEPGSPVAARASRLRAVEVRGAVSKNQLRDLYRGARALVVPSHREGFCVPVLEAHASGLPVVSRPVPAVKELLTEFDIEARDFSVSALADAMVSMMRAEDLRQHTGVSLPLRVAKQFDRESIGRALLQVYTETLYASESAKRG